MRGVTSIIDADVHPLFDTARMADFLLEPFRRRWLAGNTNTGHIGYFNPNGVRRADAVLPDGRRVESDPKVLAVHLLDEYDLEFAVLDTDVSFGYMLGPDLNYGAALASATNDILVHDWLTADSRYRGSLLVSPLDPEQAAREIDRLGDHPQVVQVIMPSAARMPYGQAYYDPIYRAAVRHNLPVAIHPGTEGTGLSYPPTPAGYPTTYFEWHTGLVCNYIGHLISLVTEGVFERFPSLRFVMMEGGVLWLAPLLWRFDKNYRALRVETPWLKRKPSEYVRDHILLTTQPIEEPADHQHFVQMTDMLDLGKMLMFSSDFPHWDGDTPDFAARQFPEALRSRIMSETARELYRLPRRTSQMPSTTESNHV